MSGMNAKDGRALAGRPHLQQSIGDILTTPIGTRLQRRTYGSLVPELIDHPLNGATRVRLFAAAADALLRWEPRIRLTQVQLQIGADGAASLLLDGVAAEQSVQLEVPIKGSAA